MLLTRGTVPLQDIVPKGGNPSAFQIPSQRVSLITTDEYLQWHQSREISPQLQQRLAIERAQLLRVEAELLQQQPVCAAVKRTIAENGNSGYKPTRTDMRQLENMVGSQFYNPEVMKEALCSMEGVGFLAANQGAEQKIRRWLGSLSVIGEPSVNGTAMSAGTALVVKVANMPGDDLLHEYLVGVKCLNDLRALNLLNFAYILGGFRCSPPLPFGGDDSKQMASYCEGKQQIQYVVYENVTPAYSMKRYIASAQGVKFLDKYLQVILALRVAHMTCDFTHYDLHPGNVLIRLVEQMEGVATSGDAGGSGGVALPLRLATSASKEIALPFPLRGKTIFIRTGGIATLIDYGNAHVRYQGQNYGNNQYIKYGILPNVAFPMSDAYRLLLGCAAEAINANNAGVLDICRRLYLFFNRTEDLVGAASKQGAYYNSLPSEPHLVAIKHDALIDHIFKEFPQELATFVSDSPPPGPPIMLCRPDGDQVCLSPTEVTQRLGAWNAPPRNLFDLNENGNQQVTLDTYKALDSQNRSVADALLKAYTAVGEQKEWLTPAGVGMDSQLAQRYSYQIDNLVKQMDLALQYRRHIVVGQLVAQRFSDTIAADYYDKSWHAFQQLNMTNLQKRVVLAISDLQQLASYRSVQSKISGPQGSIVQPLYLNQQGQQVQSALIPIFHPYRVGAYLDALQSMQAKWPT